MPQRYRRRHAVFEQQVACFRAVPSLSAPRNIESAIAYARGYAREAEARLDTLFRLGIDSTTYRPNEIGRPSERILAPGGSPVGYRIPGAGENIQTVPPFQFNLIRDELMIGARPISTPRTVQGMWFERADGLQFSLRLSEHGPTIDVVRSDNPLFRNGFKVHQQ